MDMRGKMKTAAATTFVGTVLLTACNRLTSNGILLSLAITCGTIAYHLIMRLGVGFAFRTLMGNQADYQKRRYRVGTHEARILEGLKVKKWKGKLPTYDPTLFDPRLHSWKEIAQAMRQAERVHEAIVLLSFLPIIAGRWFDAYPVFLLTSVCSAAFDMIFVIVQRYNRQRVMRFLERDCNTGK